MNGDSSRRHWRRRPFIASHDVPHPLIYVVQDLDAIAAQPLRRLDRLRTEGFDVAVASPHLDDLDVAAYEGFRTIALPGQGAPNPAAWIGAYIILQGQFLETRPSLVHGIGSPWAWIAAFAARRAEVPAIISTVERHPRIVDGALASLLSRLPGALRKRVPDAAAVYSALGRWSDAYLVNHEEEMRWLLDEQLVPGRKLELVLGGRGVDLDTFNLGEETPSVGEARDALGISPGSRTVIGAAGPWSKGARERLRALKKAFGRTHPTATWLVVDPAQTDRERDPTFYRALDVYLALNEHDAAGSEMMEAAALAVPTVAIDSPAARTVVRDYETGRIEKDEGLLGTLLVTVNDPKRCSDMGIRARARAEERFAGKHVDEQVLRIYDRVLREGLT